MKRTDPIEMLTDFSLELMRMGISSRINFCEDSEDYYFIIEDELLDKKVQDKIMSFDKEFSKVTKYIVIMVWKGVDIEPRGKTLRVSFANTMKSMCVEYR